MGRFKITDIIEADFGCEEHTDGSRAVLILENGNRVEVAEKWITENKIEEGKYVWQNEDRSVKKAIEVVAAVIKQSDKIFATQRGYGEFKDRWEFPGGKMEVGEAPEIALAREIKEELDTDISVDDHIITVDNDYPNFHITMHVYWCSIVSGELILLEHEAAKWLDIDARLSFAVDWLPADLEVVSEILKKSTVCRIDWLREDIRKVIEESGINVSAENMDECIDKFI